MKLLWMALLLVAICVSTVQGLPEEDFREASINISQPLHIVEEGNLLVLTPPGLIQMLNQTRFLMVLFHNPSSKQSRNLAKELGKAVEVMGKGKNGLGFGKVDITVEKELQKEFDVKKAPELKLFFEGNRSEPISCKGVVESAALVVWLRRQISQKAFLFNNTQQVLEFVKSRPLVIVGFFQDLEEEVAELFFDMIKDFPELTFGVISISNAIGRFHVTLDSLLVFKKGKIVKREELINDITNKQVINQVIKQHLTDFVIEYNTENKDLIYELHILNHMLLFASKSSESFGMIMKHYKLASKEFTNKILFILVDADEPRNGHIFKYFRITEVNIPCVQILNLSSDARYKMPSEEITYENLKKFGRSFLNRSAKKHQSSEDIPKYWDQGPVKQLVGKNFNVVVFDKERDVFVMFYAPWSEKCKALFPVLEELGRKYQNHSTVTIAKIDITANEIQLMYLDRYPFFNLFPTDTQQAIMYTGEHTMKGFSDFLESQIKTRIEDEDELLSIEESELTEEEALAEEKKLPFIKEELTEQKVLELENVTKLEEPAGQKETAKEEKEKVAKPKGPPKQEKKPKVKEEL
ncbi:protein disulfide-isomerase-like protein of the testis isoform X2 [Canis lupus baileyi]|uniref:Protein disulfide-isomerase-like protein of the testis n=4 Tax=Canis lupus TaxID=9612 RepID=A0A8C0Q1W4_CANLF|nr:protein disulfide-isomerase-like protein of the testis isoform X2 [Canis lupus familiaris]XP_022275735.1 protein disulfide-isomerase-like protein of the testis isoform X2 [Canis lupus familiaris]XP_025272143.1 protein disulfide-isomerase-like protein of the testis isoform X2 [Canis lupus dingo]XP_025272145.1 protein disulfide-isomerase-like protein of the testis isoform X2 [Canis lupus dingo]XP_025272146.1 protein disulfide-isomerase-like protein of the testis isoform X2 [Canis lupus dingo]|eukprot:XP_005621542.1 protein disulfide-isomerase-like protein of the testis isoform X2 [Canis lupus familiaris]